MIAMFRQFSHLTKKKNPKKFEGYVKNLEDVTTMVSFNSKEITLSTLIPT